MPLLLWLAPSLLIVGASISLLAGGWWTFFIPLFSFVLIPILDQLGPGSQDNPSEEESVRRLADPRYDLLVLLTLPLHFGFLAQYLTGAAAGTWTGASLAGAALTAGISCGVYGINVAHELGHRADRRYHLLAQALLLTSLYMHFFIEHNRGHHRRVATPDDLASARRGESLYAFWWRSVTGSWLDAWALEADRLRHAGRPVWSWNNQMLRFQLIQLAAVLTVGLWLGPAALAAWMAAALGGALLLETVNYLEHYGLQRARTERGTWERVQPHHSWNSNRSAGRMLLFDLTRHADHHAHATRPYSILRHHPAAPELPAGYPAMVLLALVPPLFFAVMDRQLDRLGRPDPTVGEPA